MSKLSHRIFVSLVLSLMLAAGAATGAFAQQDPYFTPGNLVVVVEGCGVHAGTCTAVPNGTGTGAGNSSAGGYGDNQAAPLTLFQYTPTGTSSVTFVNSLVLPQAPSGANLPVSGEYGSSSEGTLQLDGTGRYLTLMGYGIDAPTFDAAYYPNPGFSGDQFGAAPSGALAQSGSLTGQSYTPIARVVTLVDPYGNVNSSTPIYNIFNTNNPRSVYTADGSTFAYVSGQGTGCDLTGGVFYIPLLATTTSPTAITGGDAVPTSSCVASGYTGSLVAQDTRTVQVFGNTLYISIDSTEGKSDNRSLIGTLGTPPATSLFAPTTPPTGDTGGPNLITGLGNTGGTGKETITTGPNSNGNPFNAGLQINISPSNYFFANASTLYVADTGSPKQTSATSPEGDGGLQKWVNSKSNGTGTWSLAYTLYQGLNLVENPTTNPSNTSGATGLYGLTGMVSGSNVYLYATPYNISDLDPTYLYGITDNLSATTNPGTAFTLLDTAPADSNFKGVSLAPSLPAGSATITSSPSGLAFTSAGTGCAPGTYTTPITLIWTPGNACTLSVVSPQGPTGTEYAFTQWQDGTTATTDAVVAPTNSAVYTASFSTAYELTTSAGTGGTVSAGGYFTAGTNAVVTATPATGYYFVNFTGTTTSTSNPLTLSMNGPQSITANFAPQVTPTVTWPTASAITYGQTLASSMLTGGSAMSNSVTVPGTFTFTTPGSAPLAGTQSESVTFMPSNSEYAPVSNNVSVLVNQAPTTASVLPMASPITYGQTLASSMLSGGMAVSTITGLAVSGTFTFTNPATAPTTTGPRGVTFTPMDNGDYFGTTTTVTVTVTPVPIASVSPSNGINFGTLYLGSIVTKAVTIANTGDAPMTISDPLIAIVKGGDSSEFITVNLCPKSLAAGKSCTMTVTFLAGPFYNTQTATLMINDDAAGSPQSVPLTATVIDPLAQFSPGSLSFGSVKTDSGSSMKSVTVISSGGTALSISKVSIAGVDPGDFSEIDNCSSGTFNPKAACSITVTFMPTARGLRSATLVVTDNAQSSAQSILLSGTGD